MKRCCLTFGLVNLRDSSVPGAGPRLDCRFSNKLAAQPSSKQGLLVVLVGDVRRIAHVAAGIYLAKHAFYAAQKRYA